MNKFLRETQGGESGEFVEVSRYASGPKHMECRVYVSAFNHADTNVIVRAVDQAPWRDKEMVQLFIKEQEQDLFQLRYGGASQDQPGSGALTPAELRIVNNALNEVCNGIHLQGEFDTRMGCTVEQGRALLAKIHALASH